MLRSTLRCGQIYADLVDTAVELLRQNGLSPTTEVQFAHKELITKLRRLDFWVVPSQDRSYYSQTNADNLAPTTTVPQRDTTYIGVIDYGRQQSMSPPRDRFSQHLKIKRVDGAPCYHTGRSRTRLRYQKLSTTATPAPVCPS